MPIQFTELQRCLWPALAILSGRRPEQEHSSLIKAIFQCSTTARLQSRDLVSPECLRSPTSTQEVLEWLSAVWDRLSRSAEKDAVAFRRSLTNRIVSANLSPSEQADLVSALDYLARLADAVRLSQAVDGAPRPRMPFTRNEVVQKAYRKIARLAAADLPVWLSGERGAELDWMARLVHEMRGLPREAFHLLDYSMGLMQSRAVDRQELMHFADEKEDATLCVKGVERAPMETQRLLHEILARGLVSRSYPLIIALSEPFSLFDADRTGIYPDLFAFLTPMRIDVPPLRNRLEDLEGLIGHIARSNGFGDPQGRLTQDAITLLSAYHWPGNVDELAQVVFITLRARPAGPIGPEHLPEQFQALSSKESGLMRALQEIHDREGFRALASETNRRLAARFLLDNAEREFSLSEFQRKFGLGRETARRILRALVTEGLVEGRVGPRGMRVTRYKVLAGKERAGVEFEQ
ncbi:MAG: hypothetical protein FJ118_12580 [Deltaproteobacteria bacterium]|nr:hypothetical protein [Deltaproteobacteria bacterium]